MAVSVARSFDALRYRNYRLFWTGAMISNVGTWMQAIAVSWYVLLLTHSAFWVSFVSFANFFPIVLSPVAGVVADRLDRKRILFVQALFMMVAAGALAIFSWTGRPGLAVVLLLTFAQGVGFAVGGPAWMAFIPSLVPEGSVVNATAMNSVQWSLGRVLGPAIAGVLIKSFGVAPVFVVNAVSFVAVLIALVRIDVPRSEVRHEASVARELVSGFRYTWDHRAIRSIIASVAVTSFFAGPLLALLPVYAVEVFGRSAGGYSSLASAMGLGSLLGAFSVGPLGNRVTPRLIGASLAALSAVLVLFAAVGFFSAALLLVGVAGAAYLFVVVAANGYIQLHVDDAIRGRVMSLSFLAFGALYPLGSILAGKVADIWSAPVATIAGALVCATWGIGLCLHAQAVERSDHPVTTASGHGTS